MEKIIISRIILVLFYWFNFPRGGQFSLTIGDNDEKFITLIVIICSLSIDFHFSLKRYLDRSMKLNTRVNQYRLASCWHMWQEIRVKVYIHDGDCWQFTLILSTWRKDLNIYVSIRAIMVLDNQHILPDFNGYIS